MKVIENDIHIWTIPLDIPAQLQPSLLAKLSNDEQVRAKRLYSTVHQNRFIAARIALRNILGQYLNTPPFEITFQYNDHKKPYISGSPISFNLAHSHDAGLLGVTRNALIGVDIEKEKDKYNIGICDKYFSQHENRLFKGIPAENQTQTFYRIWARKEAIVKAVGKGLTLPLSSFSVSPNPIPETLMVEGQYWHLAPLLVKEGYQAALASNQVIKNISYYSYDPCKNASAEI
jgi:4'-phosphopantetheinyl transferase